MQYCQQCADGATLDLTCLLSHVLWYACTILQPVLALGKQYQQPTWRATMGRRIIRDHPGQLYGQQVPPDVQAVVKQMLQEELQQ